MPFWSRWFTKATTVATPAATPDTTPAPTPPPRETPIGTAVDRLVAALPGVSFALRPPVSIQQLDDAEAELGFELPADVSDLYLMHDGQPRSAPGLLGGLPLITLEEAMADWRGWQTVGEDYATEFDSVSFTPGAISEVYVDRGWFPLATDGGGNNLGVDCAPGPAGVRGQFINFGRDEEVKYVYAASLSAYLDRLTDLVESGRAVVEGDQDDLHWGIDDASYQWPRFADFDPEPRDELDDQAWFEALEPAWQERINGSERVEAFLAATSFSSYARDSALPRVSSLEPLGRATNLRQVLIHTRVLDDLTDLPALPLLKRLIVSTRSHVGIERFPALAEYRVLTKAPAADLSPLGAARNLNVLRLLAPHPDLRPLQSCRQLTELEVRLIGPAQVLEVAALNSLHVLTLDLRDVAQPVDQLDWRGLVGLHRLNLQLGAADSLDFLDQLPNLTQLTISDLRDADVAAVGRLPVVESVTFRDAQGLRNVAAIAGAARLRDFSGGFAAFDVLKDLRPDLPFASMQGHLTDEENERWMAWFDQRRS